MQLARPFLLAAACTLALSAQAQTKWDLPAAYPATNFHTENLVQFADDVDKATGGKLKITVHANGSLFKAQRDQARGAGRAGADRRDPAGQPRERERRSSAPTASPSWPSAMPRRASCHGAEARCSTSCSARRASSCCTPCPGRRRASTSNKEIGSVADMRGLKWRAYSPATAKIAELIGAQPVTIQAAELSQALATGVVNSYMSLGLHRLRLQDLREHQVLVRHPGLAAEERGHRQRSRLQRARHGHAGRGD